jgi:hypothetical protein
VGLHVLVLLSELYHKVGDIALARNLLCIFCDCFLLLSKLPLHAGTALLIAPLPYPFCVLRLLFSLELLPRRVLSIAPSYKSTPAKCTQTLHACRAWQVTP